ncbi:MAG: HPP family protein [Leptospirillia bacterium]
MPLPTSPSDTHPVTRLLPALGAFCSILLVGLISEPFMGASAPLLVASMGASAVILFCLPESPLATPRAFVGGHIVCVLIGISCAQWIPSIPLASALAVGGSILAMQATRCLHPPGGAAALTCVVGGAQVTDAGFNFFLFPVGLNVAVMLGLAWLFGRLSERLTRPDPPRD